MHLNKFGIKLLLNNFSSHVSVLCVEIGLVEKCNELQQIGI